MVATRQRVEVPAWPRSAILAAVGFDPYRKFRARPSDYVMVAAATVLALGLVAWGIWS